MRKGVFRIVPIWMILLVLICFVSVGFATRTDSPMVYGGSHNIDLFKGTPAAGSGEPVIHVGFDDATSTSILVVTSTAGTASSTDRHVYRKNVATTTDSIITATEESIPASWFDAGQEFLWTIKGAITGVNAIKTFSVWVYNQHFATVTLPLRIEGDFELNCSLAAMATSTQLVGCSILTSVSSTVASAPTGTIPMAIEQTSVDMTGTGKISVRVINFSASDVTTVSSTVTSLRR